jgi:hypothetical protein
VGSTVGEKPKKKKKKKKKKKGDDSPERRRSHFSVGRHHRATAAFPPLEPCLAKSPRYMTLKDPGLIHTKNQAISMARGT